MVECSKFYCDLIVSKSPKASMSTKSVSNRLFLLHRSQFPIYFLINQKRFSLYCGVFDQSVCDSYNISAGHIYCEILSFYIFIWCMQSFSDKLHTGNDSTGIPTIWISKDALKSIFIRTMTLITRLIDVGCWL